MKTVLRKIEGNWDVGFALDKQIIRRTFWGAMDLSRFVPLQVLV